jgi:hypothetical protein
MLLIRFGELINSTMFWYEDDIKGLENKRSQLSAEPETLFYGSSSIRLWPDLADSFKAFKPINLGFGGSTLAACVWFFERVMAGYQPKRMVIYAGDNDLGDGRHPEEVFIFFKQLAVQVTARFGAIPCYFISLKPSISRLKILDQFKYANTLIAGEIKAHLPNWRFIDLFEEMITEKGLPKPEYFLDDGLHLSEAGYGLWTAIVNKQLAADN